MVLKISLYCILNLTIPNSEPKYKGKWRHINIKNSNKKVNIRFCNSKQYPPEKNK